MKLSDKKYLLRFLLIFIFLWCAKPAFGFKDLNYEFDCSLDINKHLIIAQEKVSFVNDSGQELKDIFFHIYPHRKFSAEEKEFIFRFAGYFKINPFPEGFQSGGLKINAVKEKNQALSYVIEGPDQTILRVILLKPLLPNESLELNLDFVVKIPHAFGRFGWHKNIISLCRWYPMLSVFDSQGWHKYPFYPYHQPFFSQAGVYKMKLALPKNQVVIHSGVLKEEKAVSPATKSIYIDTELPVRDFSLALSSDYKVISAVRNHIKINSYYLKGDEFYAEKALEFSGDLMKNYTRNFGAYPYKEFSIAPVYLAYGGDQSSNLILIDTRVYKLPRLLIRYFDFLISHETGHQWFYNIVGSDEYQEMWLDEGINSYFILNYLEEKYGQGALVMELPKYFKWLVPNFSFRRARDYRYLYLAKNGLDRPVLSKLSSFKEPSSIFALTYGKGAMVLAMLRDLVGDKTFNKIFERYFQDFKFKNISVAEFIRIANQESGQDLNWFFEQWLKTDKKCDYAVREVRRNKIILENRGSIVMPVTTQITFSDGSGKTDNWDGRGKFKEISLSKGKRVKKVNLNPDKTLLDIDRTNNLWPRAFYKKAVPFYYGIYEVPLFLPDDSKTLVFGPEAANGGLGLKSSLQKPLDEILYLSSDYVFNGNQVKSTLGYERKHLLGQQLVAGWELFKNVGLEDRTENLDGGKLYLRKELWPVSYGLTEINDHITFYILRNRRFDGGASVAEREEVKNLSYLRNDEAILGALFYINRSGPYFNPRAGYKFSATIENAEHFLGAKEYYWREMFDVEFYKTVFKDTQLASRIKFGWGSPADKNLYQLGGAGGLRGFDLKTIRGARTMLGSLECRFPIKRDLNYRFFDNILGIEEIQAALFFDVGKSWYDDFSAARFKKDAGAGIRLHLNLGSFLERIVLRIDVSQAIDTPKEKSHVWVGINQAF